MRMVSEYKNDFGQAIGFPVKAWEPCESPPFTSIQGSYCCLQPLDAQAHAGDLYRAYAHDQENQIWTYLPYGPFYQQADYEAWVHTYDHSADPMFYAVIDTQFGTATGVASYLRIEPTVGVIEVGHINYSPLLQQTAAATEAMYLLMQRVFDECGYRRYEWKCDALNEKSMRAAVRLGFTFEGIFRQATIYKQRNRDTAWFAITDQQWPALKTAYETWLSPRNFDANCGQKYSLSKLIADSG